MRASLVLALVALLAPVSACSTAQESLACPGEDCPPALRAVADEVERLPGVTSVDRTWRFQNLDRGRSGGVDLHAAVDGRPAAARLAGGVRGIWAHSDVEPVDHVRVRVVPDPERNRPEVDDPLLVGDAAGPQDVGCAPDRCADAVDAFRDAFGDAFASSTALGSVRWSAGGGGPVTRVEVATDRQVLASADLAALENRIFDVAGAAGLTGIGDIRIILHYRQRVEYSFELEMGNARPR